MKGKRNFQGSGNAAFSLYDKVGFLNVPAIDREADRAGINFIIMIGGRQVGKTYGCIDMMLASGRHFILMRRTMTEVDFICSNINNPLSVHKKYDTAVKKDSDYTGAIWLTEGEEKKQIGALMSLSSVAKIRGFAGEEYTDLILDEFIPETHVSRIRNEGDAFLNAIVTISGNRELEGMKPLRVWLLANSNNINSPILSSLGIMEKVERMKAAGQEYSIMPDRGIMIILPKSDQIMEKRKKTSLFRAIDPDSDFARMAFGNEFSYNDASNIKPVRLAEYLPQFTTGQFTYYKHKSKPEYYVSDHTAGGCPIYPPTERGKVKCLRDNPNVKRRYYDGKVFFESQTVKERFLDYFE